MFDIRTVPKIVIREGQIGNVEITQHDSFYRLLINKQQWMAVDTTSNMELKELYSSYDVAEGNVLLSGFGFGILPQWIATKENVQSVTVIEWRKEVIDLFQRHNKLNSKIKIEIANIAEYKNAYCYDWLILDHYELDRMPNKIELEMLSRNINFDKLWFWSLEHKLSQYDSWQKFRENYSLKIPDLPLDIVSKYMEMLFKRKDFRFRQ